MDIYARLRKVMQNNNPKEFAKKLAHALPLIKLTILNELILDLAKIDSENFENYLGALLEYAFFNVGSTSTSISFLK